MKRRCFFRCRTCLSVSAVDLEEDGHGRVHIPAAVCAVDGTPISYMGAQVNQRLTKVEDAPPCDAGCTHARGPLCHCQCCGKNHGAKVVVDLLRDLGPLPQIKPVDFLKATTRAAQYREAVENAHKRLEAIKDAYILSMEQRKLKKAQRMLVHGTRLKALGAVGVKS